MNPLFSSILVVWLATFFLLRDLRLGSAFQDAATVLKIVMVLVIIAAGFLVKSPQPVSFHPAGGIELSIMPAPRLQSASTW